MIEIVLPIVPYILGGLLALAFAMLLFAAWLLRRQRTAAMWRKRHDAGKLGGRLLLTGLLLFGFSAISGLLIGLLAVAFDQTDEFFPRRRDDGLVGVVVPTTAPRPTTQPIARITPTAAVLLEVTVVDDGLTSNGNPVDGQLSAGQPNIYVFFRYRAVDAPTWTRTLLRDGQVLQESTHAWILGEMGSGHFTFEETDGFLPGDYEVRLTVFGQPAQTYSFKIKES